jgi:hypothetical protein
MRRYRRCLAAVSDGHSSEAVDGTREANTTVPLVTSAVPPALSMARGANGWTAGVASAQIWEQFSRCALIPREPDGRVDHTPRPTRLLHSDHAVEGHGHEETTAQLLLHNDK